jgi:hypothetical protein
VAEAATAAVVMAAPTSAVRAAGTSSVASLGEARGSDRFGDERFPHLDHGPEISSHLYAPFYGYGYYGPGYPYDPYCDPYSPYYKPAYCY